MPISIHNYLPSVNLHSDNPEDDENRIRILVDIEATMNTGSLEYYQWVMSQFPEMVEEYIQYGKDTAYNVVHLLAAIDLRDTN